MGHDCLGRSTNPAELLKPMIAFCLPSSSRSANAFSNVVTGRVGSTRIRVNVAGFIVTGVAIATTLFVRCFLDKIDDCGYEWNGYCATRHVGDCWETSLLFGFPFLDPESGLGLSPARAIEAGSFCSSSRIARWVSRCSMMPIGPSTR